MASRQQILDSIAALARKLGRAPARSEFISLSGISLYFVLQSFPKWNDAIRAAGLHPYSLNAKVADTALLEDWGKVVRKNRTRIKYRGKLPRHIYQRQGKFSPHTLALRFGSWSSVPRAFCRFAEGKRQWADVIAFLKAASRPVRNSHRQTAHSVSQIARVTYHPALQGRPAYGNPMNFDGLRHEPTNEQGVVLLFGMLAKTLGYHIEATRNGFPDCEAIRQVGPDRWQRVLIEFEFESKNFRDHGHNAAACDLIVCWRHNWPDCPPHLEVLELSSVVRSVAGSP